MRVSHGDRHAGLALHPPLGQVEKSGSRQKEPWASLLDFDVLRTVPEAAVNLSRRRGEEADAVLAQDLAQVLNHASGKHVLLIRTAKIPF